jgi:hypothetical protein
MIATLPSSNPMVSAPFFWFAVIPGQPAGLNPESRNRNLESQSPDSQVRKRAP